MIRSLITIMLLLMIPLLLAVIASMFVETRSGHCPTVFGVNPFVMLALVLLGITLLIAVDEINRYITLHRKEMRVTALVVKQDKNSDGGSCNSSIVFMDKKTYVFSLNDLPDALKNHKDVVHVRKQVNGSCGEKKVVLVYDKGHPEEAEILSFHMWGTLFGLGELAVLGILGRVSRKQRAAV